MPRLQRHGELVHVAFDSSRLSSDQGLQGREGVRRRGDGHDARPPQARNLGRPELGHIGAVRLVLNVEVW